MDAWGVTHDATDDVVALWERAVIGLLGHHADTGTRVLAIRERAPQFVPAIALETCGMLFKGRRSLRSAIAERIEMGRRVLQAQPNGRDAAILAVLDAWNRDAGSEAAIRLATLRVEHPADPFLAKLQHGLLFMMGRSTEMLRALESTRDAWMHFDEGRGFIRGCLAFALVENGRLEDAEREGRQAVQVQVDDAWGIHSVAHVMGMQDRAGECVSWLDQNAAGYANCGIFKRHVYWHWALMHLESGELDAALHLFDSRVRQPWVGDYRDMSNQATLLWRLEREGVDVGGRWDALITIAREQVGDHGSAFADVHYALALARGGHAETLLASLDTHVDDDEQGDQADVQRRVGAPLCRLVAASVAGEADLTEFERLAPHIQAIGGSSAQREIFEQMRLQAAVDARSPHARTWLGERLKRRPRNAWTRDRLDQIRPS